MLPINGIPMLYYVIVNSIPSIGEFMIRLATPRFGTVERNLEDVFTFPGGIYGFELQMRWLLLGDREHGALYWLQNIEQVELSLAVVDPREFVAGYVLETSSTSLASFWNGSEPIMVLSVLTEYEGQLCLNLQHPVVINPSSRLGRQVKACDDRPLRYVLSGQTAPLMKSA